MVFTTFIIPIVDIPVLYYTHMYYTVIHNYVRTVYHQYRMYAKSTVCTDSSRQNSVPTCPLCVLRDTLFKLSIKASLK